MAMLQRQRERTGGRESASVAERKKERGRSGWQAKAVLISMLSLPVAPIVASRCGFARQSAQQPTDGARTAHVEDAAESLLPL